MHRSSLLVKHLFNILHGNRSGEDGVSDETDSNANRDFSDGLDDTLATGTDGEDGFLLDFFLAIVIIVSVIIVVVVLLAFVRRFFGGLHVPLWSGGGGVDFLFGHMFVGEGVIMSASKALSRH